MSHPAGVRGLKLDMHGTSFSIHEVAPRRGAWVETQWIYPGMKIKRWSHPAGVRGLKQSLSPKAMRPAIVAPRRGAWVETQIL